MVVALIGAKVTFSLVLVQTCLHTSVCQLDFFNARLCNHVGVDQWIPAEFQGLFSVGHKLIRGLNCLQLSCVKLHLSLQQVPIFCQHVHLLDQQAPMLWWPMSTFWASKLFQAQLVLCQLYCLYPSTILRTPISFRGKQWLKSRMWVLGSLFVLKIPTRPLQKHCPLNFFQGSFLGPFCEIGCIINFPNLRPVMCYLPSSSLSPVFSIISFLNGCKYMSQLSPVFLVPVPIATRD